MLKVNCKFHCTLFFVLAAVPRNEALTVISKYTQKKIHRLRNGSFLVLVLVLVLVPGSKSLGSKNLGSKNLDSKSLASKSPYKLITTE